MKMVNEEGGKKKEKTSLLFAVVKNCEIRQKLHLKNLFVSLSGETI